MTGMSVPGHGVEHGPAVGRRQPSSPASAAAWSTSGSTTSTAGTLSPTGARAYLRRPSVTWTQLPQTPPIAQSRIVVASPVSSGTSDRPCVRCAGVTPKTSASVAWRSTLVVRASHVPPPLDARPVDQQRRVAERLVLRHAGLAPEVVAARARRPGSGRGRCTRPPPVESHRPPLVERVQDPAEPVVDHRHLGAVVGPEVTGLALAEQALGHAADRVGRPDQPLAVPRLVLVRPSHGAGDVEGLVGVELVDEEQPAVVVRRGPAQPVGRRGHHPRAGEVLLGPEARCGSGRRPGRCRRPSPALAARRTRTPPTRRRADPARVGMGPPGVALVAPLVVPGEEVGVVVLAAGLEQVRVVRDEHRRHPGVPQGGGDRRLPELDRAPGLPEEVERAAEDVVAGGHARQRAGDVAGEAGGPVGGEAVEVRRVEVGAAVAPEVVAVERVEQDDDDVVAASARRHVPRRAGGPPPNWDGSGPPALRVERATASLADQLGLDLEGDLLADDHAAGLEGLVPVQAPVLPVQLARGGEAQPGAAPRDRWRRRGTRRRGAPGG